MLQLLQPPLTYLKVSQIFNQTTTTAVDFIKNKPIINTTNNSCLVGRTSSQATFGFELGNSNRALISGQCDVSDTTSKINLNAKQIFAPDITHVNQSTTTTNQIWRHYGSGVLVQNSFNPSGLFPASGHPKQFITMDFNNNIIWNDTLNFDANRKIKIDTANISLKLYNKNADLENEDIGHLDFHGENENLYSQITSSIKSSTNNARRSYIKFMTCNGTGNNVQEIFRVGQGVFAGNSDCTAEFYNGRVKIPEIKFDDGYVQSRALVTPTAAEDNFVLRANNNGSWHWSAENTSSGGGTTLPTGTSYYMLYSDTSGNPQWSDYIKIDTSISKVVTTKEMNSHSIIANGFFQTNIGISFVGTTSGTTGLQSQPLLSPATTYDNNKVLTANNNGTFEWKTPSINLIDDNSIASDKTWSSSEIHHNIVKGSFQNCTISNNQITFNRYNDNDIVQSLTTNISTNNTDYITITNGDEEDINTENISIYPVRFGKNNRNITDQGTIMIGQEIGKNMSSSKVNNLAIGYNAMKLDDQFYNQNWESISDNNIAIGHNCMSNVKGGTNFKYNTMLGSYSSFGLENENFANNVGVGYGAFNYIVGVGNTSNSINDCVAIGYYSGAGSKFSDCTYIGCEVGQSNNTSSNGYNKRIMIGNKHHTLLVGKCENNANSTFKINAGHIEIDVDDLPTSYNSNFPNRVWSDLGILRVGPIYDGTIANTTNNRNQCFTGTATYVSSTTFATQV